MKMKSLLVVFSVCILKWQLMNLRDKTLEDKVLVIRKVAMGRSGNREIVEKDRRFVEHHRIILYLTHHMFESTPPCLQVHNKGSIII